MKIAFVTATCAVLAFQLCGCQSGREAQNVARIALSETITYGDEVDKKIKAEEAYYKSRVEHLKKDAQDSEVVEESNIVARHSANLEASLTDSNSGHRLTDAELRDFIDKCYESTMAARTNTDAILAANDSLFKSLTALDSQKDALESVRQGLEQMQAGHTSVEKVKELIVFGKSAAEAFEKSDPK